MYADRAFDQFLRFAFLYSLIVAGLSVVIVVLILATASVTGLVTGLDYEVTDVVEDYSREGASMSKVFVNTDATSEEDFREIADQVREQRDEALLWMEFYDGSIDDTTGVVLDLDDGSGVEFGGGFSASGGEEGDGIYVVLGEEIPEDYPSGERGFSWLVSY